MSRRGQNRNRMAMGLKYPSISRRLEASNITSSFISSCCSSSHRSVPSARLLALLHESRARVLEVAPTCRITGIAFSRPSFLFIVHDTSSHLYYIIWYRVLVIYQLIMNPGCAPEAGCAYPALARPRSPARARTPARDARTTTFEPARSIRRFRRFGPRTSRDFGGSRVSPTQLPGFRPFPASERLRLRISESRLFSSLGGSLGRFARTPRVPRPSLSRIVGVRPPIFVQSRSRDARPIETPRPDLRTSPRRSPLSPSRSTT